MRNFFDKNLYRIIFAIQIIAVIDILIFVFIYFDIGQIVTVLSYLTIFAFLIGTFFYLRKVYFLKTNIDKLKKRVHSMKEVISIAALKGRDIPKFAIFVPARNEGRVIENTIRRLAALDYPKDAYKIYVIVDERELKDNVERFTKDVAKETILDLQKDHPAGFINCVEVPEWYSGELGNFSHTYAHSTKGRALNYCLEYIRYTGDDQDIEMVGVLDADGRLDIDALKEVSYVRMMKESKIIQGVVLGISNVDKINLVGIGAMLELVSHHLTYMASRLMNPNRKLLFLAGTNYFFEKELLETVGGWNAGSLVEDAELGLRTYVMTGHSAEWYSCPEIEQSPANLKTYFKQRERWARGHLQLIPLVAESSLPWFERVVLTLKLYIGAHSAGQQLILPMMGWGLMILGVYGFLPFGMQFVMFYLLFATVTMLDLYGNTYRSLKEYLEPYRAKKMTRWHMFKTSVALYFYSPFHFFVQLAPRIYAPFKYYSAPNAPQMWYKTERTEEKSEMTPQVAVGQVPALA